MFGVVVDHLVFAPAGGNQHAVAVGVQHGFPGQVVGVVIFLFNDDLPGLVGADAAGDVVVGLAGDVALFVKHAVDAAEIVVHQRGIAFNAEVAFADPPFILIVDHPMLAPAGGLEHAVAVGVQHDLQVDIAVFIVILLKPVASAERHRLVIGVEVARQDDPVVAVVRLFDDDLPGLVGPDIAGGVVVGLADDVAVFIEHPVDAAVIAVQQRGVARLVEVALGNAVPGVVPGILRPGPAALARHGLALRVQARIDGHVAVRVISEGLRVCADAVEAHELSVRVEITHQRHPAAVVEFALQRHDAVAALCQDFGGVVIGLAHHIALIVVFVGVARKALRTHDQLVVFHVVLMEQLFILGEKLLQLGLGQARRRQRQQQAQHSDCSFHHTHISPGFLVRSGVCPAFNPR